MNAVHGQQQSSVVSRDRSAKPDRLFDKEDEWAALMSFSSDPHPGTSLGVVMGRPRQGKTLLLESVARATDGFYFCGQEATEAESLRRLGEEYARYRQVAQPSYWRNWKEGIDALLALGDTRPLPVFIDSFPDLVAASPALPSVIHGALRHLDRPPLENRARLLLSGETAPVMTRLFAPSSPLHALAALKLDIQPLDFRKAAQLWGIDDDPALAFLVYTVVGGTPAYRHDYVNDDVPVDRDDFDAWVCRTILNPCTPLFHEARHLLDEETGPWSHGVCHSVLAALARGCTTHGEIATFLGQQLTDAARALALLRDHGLLQSQADGLQPGITRHRIADPLLAFEHAVARPRRAALEQSDAETVWEGARTDFNTLVAGPRFAQVCRDWAACSAGSAALGAENVTASYGSLSDPSATAGLDAEVVVRRQDGHPTGRLLSVGLARWHTGMDIHHLQRLRRILEGLSSREDVRHVRLALYGASGFSPELHAAHARGDVMLVDLENLYRGA
ncbi:AAA family ATPase [Streptomyces atratus]|uniref:AAA family ATPase n=1 Tax=Streptomyces atratus TaxID=1893 RepID=UPI002256E7FD|nr:ArsR family transcriptional regulator [Streptomyces atratus]MCX5338762.1 ArsR family transcriptional regulator [Streptomyces atratus]